MERRAINLLFRAARSWRFQLVVAGLLLAEAAIRVEAQQPAIAPFVKDLATVGVSITPGQPPANGASVPQNFPQSFPHNTPQRFPQNAAAGGNADPNHVFDNSGSAPKPVSTSALKVLVLKSGRTVQGSIRADSRGYFVESRQFSLYFPFAHVKFIATDMQEAYTKLCDSVAGTSSHRDLLLGRWCLENNLRPEAADHYRNVLTFEPSNREARQALARLQQSQTEEPTEERQGKQSVTSTDSQYPESLSRLSGSAVREFVIGVQPILLARCGSVKCHGTGDPSQPATTSFRLEHVRLSNSNNRAATARNLEAVLNQLDGQFPSQSPFFQRGLQAHGGSTLRPPLDGPSGHAQEMRLRRWVDSIAPERNRLKREQASRDFVNRFSRSQKPPTLRDPNVTPASATMDAPESGAMDSQSSTPRPNAATGFQNSGDSPKRLGPLTDPFDPSRFNSGR